MRLLKAIAITGLAATLTAFGQSALAQTGTYTTVPSSGAFGSYNNSSFQNSWSSENRSNPWMLEQRVNRDIAQASQQGLDVTDATYFDELGRLALREGRTTRAMADFKAAEDALGSYGTITVLLIYPGSGQNANQAGWKESNQGESNQFQGANFEQSGNGQWEARQLEGRLIGDMNRADANGANTHEAAVFENKGLQALQNGDNHRACEEFRAAEMALGPDSSLSPNFRNVAGNVNVEEKGNVAENDYPIASSENVSANENSGTRWGQAWQLRRDIDEAQAQGYDVTDAQYFVKRGREALENGNQSRAFRDFNKAQAALEESGFQGVQQANRGSNNQVLWNQAGAVQRDINQARNEGFDVTDAQHFEHEGRMALENGNAGRAIHDFDMAEAMINAGPGNSFQNTASQQAYNQQY